MANPESQVGPAGCCLREADAPPSCSCEAAPTPRRGQVSFRKRAAFSSPRLGLPHRCWRQTLTQFPQPGDKPVCSSPRLRVSCCMDAAGPPVPPAPGQGTDTTPYTAALSDRQARHVGKHEGIRKPRSRLGEGYRWKSQPFPDSFFQRLLISLTVKCDSWTEEALQLSPQVAPVEAPPTHLTSQV